MQLSKSALLRRHLAACIAIALPLAACGAGDPEPAPVNAPEEQLGQMLEESFVQGQQIPAVFLAVQAGDSEPIVIARGVRDLDSMAPVEPDDHVRVGSITKTFTAIGILLLAQEGKLTLDDPIEMWLPGVMSSFEQGKIKIRYLLNHTSGLPNIWGVPPDLVGAMDPKGCEPNSLDLNLGCNFYTVYCTEPAGGIKATALVTAINTEASPTAPNAKPLPTPWGYANTNYNLLGMIIEKVAGQTWEKFVTERFIDKLGLTGTSIPVMGTSDTSIPAPYAHGYISPAATCPLFSDSPNMVDYSVFAPDPAWSAGAIISTVEDIARWIRAVQSGQVLDPEYLEIYKTLDLVDASLCPNRKPAKYGLGITVDEIEGYWGHRGQILGYDCSMQYQPIHDTVYVACATKTFPSADCNDTTYPPAVMENTNPVVTGAAAILYP